MLSKEELEEIKSGDNIKFRAATRSGNRAAIRKVITVDFQHNKVQVSQYHGWPGFVVLFREILEVLN